MASKYPFKNLVFEGGGVKGIAYIGTLDVIDEHNILEQIDRVAGTSAGAITAALVSFGLSAKDTISLLNSLDYSKVPEQLVDSDSPWIPNFIEDGFDKIFGDAESVYRLFTQYGWYTTDYIYTWLQETIAKQCDGNGKATFADFQKKSFRDLYIVVTNLSRHTSQIYSAETTPTVAVADAVRMSISIPLFFESLQFDGAGFGGGDYHVDGGVLNNYPIHIFDASKYVEDESLFIGDTNWETLGCHLFTPPNCPDNVKPVTNLLTFFENLIETIINVQAIQYERELATQRRSINISNCCIMATDFQIKPNSQQYNELVEAGKTGTNNYLNNYTRPTEQEMRELSK